MKIDPANLDQKEAHELFVGAALPRPIALVSTIGEDGVYNLAPFSFFIPMSVKPAIVGLGIGRRRDGSRKDTLVNIESSKNFVVNVVTETLAEAMNQTAGEYPPEVDEFGVAGLTPTPGDLVRCPLLKESPVNIECRLLEILQYGESPRFSNFVIGEALRVHVRDDCWADGRIRPEGLNAIGRMGGDFYCRTRDVFEMKRPLVQKEP